MVAGQLNVGIVGASGFTGAELLRLCAQHPNLEVVLATGDTQAGVRAAELYPSLAGAYRDLVFTPYDPAACDGLDLVFLALPHGAAQGIVPDLRKRVGALVDLSADFRLKDAVALPDVVRRGAPAPEPAGRVRLRPARAVPGRRSKAPSLVAAPGCYVTAASLALAPLCASGSSSRPASSSTPPSGVSGAGRPAKPTTSFCTVDEDFTAYGLLDHRHTPEIEQAIGAQVLFTPHLAPMNRGILATCYARPRAPRRRRRRRAARGARATPTPTSRSWSCRDGSPSTKATLGSNTAHLTARYDDRTGWVVVLCALDNLVKGASGQALQCANLVLGLPETAGLPIVGVYP